MSYFRRPYGGYGGFGRGFGYGGRVRVGRKYVFSNTPRPGFFPKMTRRGMAYVKYRRY